MPNYSRVEIVLVRFPFSDLSNIKIRPAVVINGSHPSSDLLRVALTSKLTNLLPGEFVLSDWNGAGLNVPSRLNGEDSKYYEVIVNEETLLTKYVRKSDSWYRVVTWQDHILDTFAIDFDKSKNPIRETPDGKIKEMGALKVARFAARSFDGDWLKVEWDVSGSEHHDDLRKDSGWIRWRESNRLLIGWSYFA
jgi:hypothetical protein